MRISVWSSDVCSSALAARALAYWAAGTLDRAKREPDDARRKAAQARLDLLIPLVTAWCTDAACEVASLGVQVHGGMGVIEEAGDAPHDRAPRLLPRSEAPQAIQAATLTTTTQRRL